MSGWGVDATIRVWEIGTWREVRSLTNHLGPVHGLAFRPSRGEGEPASLASAGGDGTLRIWQPGLGRMVRIVRHPSPIFCVEWDHDGSHLLTGAKDGRLRVVEGVGDAILVETRLSRGAITSLSVPDRGSSLVAGDSRGEVFSSPMTR